MTRRRIDRLPGSRGPFFGPSGKQLEDFQDSERAARADKELGLVFDAVQESTVFGLLDAVSPDIHIAKFFPLRSQNHRWRFTAARAQLADAVTATLSYGLYSCNDNGILTILPGALTTIGFATNETRTAKLDTEVHLDPYTQYFAGFWYTSALNRTWAGALSSNNASNLCWLHYLETDALPKTVDLLKIPRYEPAGTATERALISVAYLTPLGERVF